MHRWFWSRFNILYHHSCSCQQTPQQHTHIRPIHFLATRNRQKIFEEKFHNISIVAYSNILNHVRTEISDMAEEIRPAKEVKVPTLQSSVMIGHGPKRDVSKCIEEIKRDAAVVDVDTGVHSHIKKDYYFYNRYPKTTQALFQSPGIVGELAFRMMLSLVSGHIEETPLAAKNEVIRREYSLSHRFYLYFQWYAKKSPSVRDFSMNVTTLVGNVSDFIKERAIENGPKCFPGPHRDSSYCTHFTF